MATAPFDTLRIARALRDAGFDEKQSEAIVSAIQDSLGQNVATKTDISVLRADIYRALWIQGGVLVSIMMGIATVAVAIIALIL